MTSDIRIRPAPGRWSVRSGGAVLGESLNALELTEGAREPVIYFPRKDIAMAMLDRTSKTTHCPKKGDAAYFTIVNRSARVENAAWTYEQPLPDVAEIKDYLAFEQSDMVKVEQV
jgi:uncharacterized protein (DUF427 family)